MFCNDDNIEYKVNYEANRENIYNWYTKVDLVCRAKSATSLIAISAFAGVAIGCLFIPRLGDLYGRKPVWLVSMLVQGPVLLFAATTTNLMLLYIVVFIAGPIIIGRMSCGFLLLMEHAPRRKQPMIGGVLMITEGSV